MNRKIFALIYTLVITVAFTSCNLFIEDEAYTDDPYAEVPVHEGEGYDEAVSVSDGDVDVTYQYKRHVRRVSDDEARRWVRYVEYDGTAALIEVHYDAQTPQALLPVKGEILMCTELGTFKWGCMHRITNITRQGDVYVLVGVLVSLDEAFERLDINGAVDFGDTTLYNADGEVYVDENDTLPPANAAPSRRAVDFEHIDPFNFDIYCGDFAFQSTFSIGYSNEFGVEYGVYSGTVTMPKDENYIRITDKLVFGDGENTFSLDNMKFSIIEAVEQHWQISFEGAVELSWKKKFKFGTIFPKTFLIGNVVPLTIWIHLQLEMSASMSASLTIAKSKTTVKKCTFDLENGTSTGYQDYNEPFECNGHVIQAHDGEWEFGGELPSFDFHITASVPMTVGLFGKVISMTIEPYFTPVQFTIPPYPTAKKPYNFRSNAYLPYDLTTETAVTLEGLYGLKIKAGLDLSLKALLGVDDDDDPMKDATDLKQLKKAIKEKDPAIAQWTEKPDNEGELKFSNQVPLIDLDVHGTMYKHEWPIFPRLQPNSLHTLKWWNKQRESMTYQAEYTIQDAGIYHAMLGNKLQPALLMLRDQRIVRLYLPNGVKKDDKVNTDIAGKTYVFDIDAREDDKEYMICPAYLLTKGGYILEEGNKEYLKGVDKQQKYNLTSPSATLVEVTPIRAQAVHNHLYPDVYNGEFPYTVTFYFDTWTHAVGVPNMATFGVVDTEKKNLKHTYSEGKDKKNMKDGYYLFHFTKKIYTYQNEYSDAQFYANLAAFYTIEDEQGRYEYTSDPTLIIFSWGSSEDGMAVCSVKSPLSDESIEYYVPKQRIPYTGNTKAPRRSHDFTNPPAAQGDYLDGELELLSIEDEAGNIVWQK